VRARACVTCAFDRACIHHNNTRTQAACQQCSNVCRCPKGPPVCPVGVSLVADGCGCCKVCAKQLGDVCTEADSCDPHRGLYCAFSTDLQIRIGVCSARDGVPCELGGTMYLNGERFEPSCKYRCTCDRGIGCVPLCAQDVRLHCPHPRHVKLPGKCCEEWVCDGRKEPNSTPLGGFALPERRTNARIAFLPSSPGAAYRQEETYGPDPESVRDNCIVQTTEWSACSHTCGLGVSSRVTNDNRQCRLERQTRLCTVRPCDVPLQDVIKKGKKCMRTPKAAKPKRLEFSGCTSVKTFRPKYCGQCTDGRCCTPHHTSTASVDFRCPGGERLRRQVMVIHTCACHYNCPSANDVFDSPYQRHMIGDMAKKFRD
uniref:CCN family member 3 n=1 Tax=Petromyzon marinus TaxID=7757 RepID=S4RBU1_PETMA